MIIKKKSIYINIKFMLKQIKLFFNLRTISLNQFSFKITTDYN